MSITEELIETCLENIKMVGDELESRVRTSNKVVALVGRFSRGGLGAARFGDQLLRAATGASAAYAEARCSESARDFVHKMGIGLKELRECVVWLDSSKAAELAPAEEFAPLLDEADQLIRIFFASRKTAKRNIDKKSKT